MRVVASQHHARRHAKRRLLSLARSSKVRVLREGVKGLTLRNSLLPVLKKFGLKLEDVSVKLFLSSHMMLLQSLWWYALCTLSKLRWDWRLYGDGQSLSKMHKLFRTRLCHLSRLLFQLRWRSEWHRIHSRSYETDAGLNSVAGFCFCVGTRKLTRSTVFVLRDNSTC